jgi:glycerate kinase
VDVAAASGLTRLAPSERDPLRASSAGTGALIREAARCGARRVILGLGGSATVDGGKGALEALGFRFLDAAGAPVAGGGAGLTDVAAVDDHGVPAAVRALELLAAHDVESPLTGPRGAAAVFGPQKGAGPAAVARLEAGLARWAHVLLGPEATAVAACPGMGAAGGIGFGLHALLHARLQPGGELVWEAAGHDRALVGCDVVIVGEGRLDGQTATGKAPAVVARHARAKGIPVLAVAGCLGPGASGLPGLADVEACTPDPPDPLPGAAEAAQTLAAATERLLLRFLGIR